MTARWGSTASAATTKARASACHAARQASMRTTSQVAHTAERKVVTKRATTGTCRTWASACGTPSRPPRRQPQRRLVHRQPRLQRHRPPRLRRHRRCRPLRAPRLFPHRTARITWSTTYRRRTRAARAPTTAPLANSGSAVAMARLGCACRATRQSRTPTTSRAVVMGRHTAAFRAATRAF